MAQFTKLRGDFQAFKKMRNNPHSYQEPYLTKDTIDLVLLCIKRLNITTRALSLAVNALSHLEPGDSRAVSNEFVALCCILNLDFSPEVIKIIEEALKKTKDPQIEYGVLLNQERQRLDPGIQIIAG